MVLVVCSMFLNSNDMFFVPYYTCYMLLTYGTIIAVKINFAFKNC